LACVPALLLLAGEVEAEAGAGIEAELLDLAGVEDEGEVLAAAAGAAVLVEAAGVEVEAVDSLDLLFLDFFDESLVDAAAAPVSADLDGVALLASLVVPVELEVVSAVDPLADFDFLDLLEPAEASVVALSVLDALPEEALVDLVFLDLLVVAVAAVPESDVD
jgi:hypothetical protein